MEYVMWLLSSHVFFHPQRLVEVIHQWLLLCRLTLILIPSSEIGTQNSPQFRVVHVDNLWRTFVKFTFYKWLGFMLNLLYLVKTNEKADLYKLSVAVILFIQQNLDISRWTGPKLPVITENLTNRIRAV